MEGLEKSTRTVSPVLGRQRRRESGEGACSGSRRTLERQAPGPRLRTNFASPRRVSTPVRDRASSRQPRDRSRHSTCTRRSRHRSRSPSLHQRTSRQPRSRSRDSGSRQRESRSFRSRSNLLNQSHRGDLCCPQHQTSPGQRRSQRRSPRCLRHSPHNQRGSPHSTRRSRQVAAQNNQSHHRSRSPLHPTTNDGEQGQAGNAFDPTNLNFGLHNTSSDGLNILIKALKTIIPDPDRLGSLNVNNTVPEFDPARKEQTMTIWLHKVNECASIYGWTEKQTVHYALPKLRGVAKRWYEGLSSVLFSWTEWQIKLLAAFPSEENYGQMLSDMLAKRAHFGDSLEDYYYDKIVLINRCGISGKRAVECVLHGIDDRTVRLGAEAAQYDDLDKLLTYLRNSRNLKQDAVRKNNRNLIGKNQPDVHSRPPSARNIRCLNCKQEGHFVSHCSKPIKKCSKCLKIGHEAGDCFSKLPLEKSVNQVSQDGRSSNKYFKPAFVNNASLDSFVDLGSECSMLKVSELSKLDNVQVQTNDLPTLRGFGNSSVITLGKVRANVCVDGVSAEIDILIVPDDVMQIPLMIGQTFTEQSHVVIHKTSDCLKISQTYDTVDPDMKVRIFCKDETSVSGLTIVDVYTKPKFEGVLFVGGGLQNRPHCCLFILSGVYSFDFDGNGQIVINRLDKNESVLLSGTLISRGIVANEERPSSVMRVSTVDREQHLSPINADDLEVGSDLDASELEQLLNLLNKYRKCFAFTLSELGNSNVTQVAIDLQNTDPVVYRPYRLAMKEKEIVRDIVNELLENDIVRHSTSPYASPVVLVRKKTGDYRLCIDYRALNKKIVRERYPMPLIDDQLDALAGNMYFTTLDLASGYYQIVIREEDKQKTAFVTPEGHFEFNRMPFGLANAPATFQRMMHQVLGNLRHREALAYLDDIIIPSKNIMEGIARLECVLNLLSEAGLTLKLSKCVFFGRTVNYLGFEISREGICPGTKKLEAVENFPTPSNHHTVRQFLGLASFFRRFIKGFSIIAKPLTRLLKKDQAWVWGPDQQHAFNTLKDSLIRKPTLALYDPKAQTELHTDACKVGVAGILLQRDEQNILKPVSYYSKQTTPEEQNYSSYDLETLAVVSSLQKFRVYLIGIPFKIVTDCNSLRATFLKRDMLPRVARWWTQMQEFEFDIEYRAGRSMAHVDALSRNPTLESKQIVQTVCNVEETDWIVTVQNADSEIQRIIGILNDPQFADIVDIKDNYKLKSGRLFRVTADGDKWVVPKGVRWQVVKQNHDDIGHFALEKTLDKIKSRYWFPGMRKFITKYVSSCLECAYAKASGGKRPGYLHPIEKIDVPFDTLHTDHLGPFVRSSRGNMYILVTIDAFTRYIYLKPVRNTKSNTTVKVLQEYFSIFGVPRRLISDRGTSFTSEHFKRFVIEKGIKHILNAVATPRANGQVERYNKVIVDSLTAKCVGTIDSKWDDHLPDVQWGINNTFNKGINKTPAEALFGMRQKGPSESKLVTALEDEGITSVTPDIDTIREEINSHVKITQESQKNIFDKSRCKPLHYKKGDLVRVERQVPATGSSKKLIPKFQGPYKITNVFEHDRYQIEDTPLTRKGNKKYSTVVAVDKIKPWLNFNRPHDAIISDEE